MNESHDEIKTLLEELSTSDLPASARLIAVLELIGIKSPSDVGRLTGLRERAVRKSKQTLTEHRHCSAGTVVPDRHCGAAQTGTVVPQRNCGAGDPCADSRARAYKESSTKIVISKKERKEERKKNKQPLDSLTELQVSAADCVKLIHAWMPGASAWDDSPARQWLASMIAEHGATIVKSAIMQTDRKLIAGDLIARPLNYVSKCAAQLKTKSEKPEKISGLELLKQRAAEAAKSAEGAA